jgi:hypothetical protein
VILTLFPPTFVITSAYDGRGWNANNNPACIRIFKDLASHESWIGVLAQERYEWGFKIKWTPLLWIPALFMEKRIEVMGHAVEAYVAATYDGFDFEEYEKREAESLQWYAPFREMSFEERLALLQTKREAAAKWVKRHASYIERAIEWKRNLG